RAIFAPLAVLADVIPLLGDIVGAGAGIVAWLLGLAWSCIVIAVAWVRFRPIVAGCLLAAAVALIGFLFMKGRKKAA
ncbi:MAG: TMEM43 family protein, partial [Fretibacterium sp.]|nr:TMEM43 family protein [Fretibacterium sp.]